MSETNLDVWVQETCHSICTMADLRAICSHRKFPALKKGNKKAYAEYMQLRLLQNVGLDRAFENLDEQSLWALHALKCIGKPIKFIDLCDFFGTNKPLFNDVSEELKTAFEQVKEKLLRRGIILIRESNEWRSRNESRLFYYEILFPESFEKQLPPLPLVTEKIEANPSFKDWRTAVLDEIRESIDRDSKSQPRNIPIVPPAKIQSGTLQIGDSSRMDLNNLFQAVKNRWLGLTIKNDDNKNRYYKTLSGPFASSTVPTQSNYRTAATQIGNARGHILYNIPKGHGIIEENLKNAYTKFYCSLDDKAFEIFIQEGIRFGFLARITKQGNNLIVPNPNAGGCDSSPTFSGLNEVDNEVKISLKRVNLMELLLLAQVSKLRITRSVLYAEPLPVQIGRLLKAPKIDIGFDALRKASSIFDRVFKEMGKRIGNVITHANVSVVRIASDELRNSLLSKYPDKMAELGEGYFAVSQKDLPVIITFGKKKGFSPKMIRKQNRLDNESNM